MNLIDATYDFFSAMERCDTKWLNQFLSPEFSFNGHYPPFTKDAFITGQYNIIGAFDDWKYTLSDLEVGNHEVAGHSTISGRHARDLQLPSKDVLPFRATDKLVQTEKQKFVLNFEEDQISKLWTKMGPGVGMKGVLDQLGIYLDRFQK